MSTPTPNLILLGSQKCATTTLHAVLNEHPDIFMSNPVKEPMFFYPFEEAKSFLSKYRITRNVQSHEDLLKNYMAKGYSNERYFGESTTGYTYHDIASKYRIAERMREVGSDFRFIYIVRNPLERIQSFYRHLLKRKNWQGLSFVDFQRSSAFAPAFNTSCYASQIKPYLEYFELKKFYFCNFEDVVRDQSSTAQKIYEFLGLPNVTSDDVIKLNVSPSVGQKTTTLKFDKVVLDEIYENIIAEVSRFSQLTGFRTDVWDLRYENWVQKFD